MADPAPRWEVWAAAAPPRHAGIGAGGRAVTWLAPDGLAWRRVAAVATREQAAELARLLLAYGEAACACVCEAPPEG